MTPSELISHLQAILGDGYSVSAHPVKRSEPQFDVFPEPRENDPEGNPYRVTFSVRIKDMPSVTPETIERYAEAIVQNIAVQKMRKKAAPEWRQ